MGSENNKDALGRRQVLDVAARCGLRASGDELPLGADLKRLTSRLQSFADRLCNDKSLGERYEGDEAELRTAIQYLRQYARAAVSAATKPTNDALRVAELEAALFAYASELPLNADGDPDVGSIHANIRALKAQVAATKPTVDLSDEQIDAIATKEHPDGRCTAGSLRKFARALLATKPAGVPTDYVLMPKKLTAENGAKGLLSGEFHEYVPVECPECLGTGDDSYHEDCPECKGEGKVNQRVTVSWDTIKNIYALAVSELSAPTAAPADHVRNQALEEAAKTAEATRVATVQYGLSLFQDGDGTRRDIAEEIRALKSTATQTTEGEK